MAAPTIFQLKAAQRTSAGTTTTVTFDTTPTSNACIVVCVGTNTNYSGLSMADNQGNTYTSRAQNGYSTLSWGRIYTAPAVTSSGTFTITATHTSGLCSIVAFEVRGWNAASPIEHSGSAWFTISSANSPYSPLNFTTGATDEVLFIAGMFWNTGVARTWIGDSGVWTTQSQYTASDSIGNAVISKAVTDSTTVAYDPTWTGGAGSQDTTILGISIKTGSDGAGGSSTKPAFYYSQL